MAVFGVAVIRTSLELPSGGGVEVVVVVRGGADGSADRWRVRWV